MADTLSKHDIEHLLSEQTKVILGAVDERLTLVDHQMDGKFGVLEQQFDEKLTMMDHRMDEKLMLMEQRMDEKYAKESTLQNLMKTLDHFLKRLTDYEDEFRLLKADVDKIKQILKEKLDTEVLI